MKQQKNYLFRRRSGTLGRVLVRLGLAPNYKRLPIFGVQGAGKSYFIMSLAYFISARQLGVAMGETANYANSFLPVMMRGERLDATQGYRDVDLQIDRVYRADFQRIFDDLDASTRRTLQARKGASLGEEAGEEEAGGDTRVANFQLATTDLSGAQFTDAMERLSDPTAKPGGNPQTQRFSEIVDDGDGAIVVVDVVRRQMSPEEFAFNRVGFIRAALAEQVIPLIRGIQLSTERRNRKNRDFPLFLIFTKRDTHRMERAELEKIVREIFAIQLAALDDSVKLRIHSVQNIGFGVDPESFLEMEKKTAGVGLFLADVLFWI